MESEIERAVRARREDFMQRSDSLTLEGVRRTLEEDMHLEKYALDAHKKRIKKLLDEVVFNSPDDENGPELHSATEVELSHSVEGKSKDAQPSATSDKASLNDAEEREKESLSYGDHKKDGCGNVKNSDSKRLTDVNEDMIREAMKKRACYIRDNIQTISLQDVRRTLEQDLKLETKTLDAHKKFISKEIEEILEAPDEVKATNGVKNKRKRASNHDDEHKGRKVSKRDRERSESVSGNDNCSVDEESDKKSGSKRQSSVIRKANAKMQKKGSGNRTVSSTLNRRSHSDEESDEEGSSPPKDDNSHSPAEEDMKRKQTTQKATQGYGKRVEHLKSIIKSCGLGIPPTVYRKAKQAPESQREAYLIKELQEVLKKEGLSTNPSEKEIKAVKKRKEKEKDLEGIDTSNIISSSRRRTSSFIPLPKPKIEVESDSDDDEEEEDEDVGKEEEDDDVDKGDEDEHGEKDEGEKEKEDDDDGKKNENDEEEGHVEKAAADDD